MRNFKLKRIRKILGSIAVSSAQNGGFGIASGSGTGFLGPFGQAGATGQGTGSSFGK
jgi:hypothetical protein